MNAFDHKKTRIIETATTVFAKKGFSSSTISNLSKEAGLGEATIYKHFKNKEDILLSIPVKYFHDFRSSTEDRLRGIKNPEERLRTYIWQYLWWSQGHKDFIKLLLLEIQPHPNYYHSKAYDLLKKGLKVPMLILEDGKEAGLFREKVSPRVFRDFLMGTSSYLFLTRILFNRSFEVLDDFDDLAGFIVAAVRKDEDASSIDIREVEEKKERILLAAEEIFYTKMFSETTISEIAGKAGVADGTIYEYFKNKEDLLFSNFEKRMKEFIETFDETLRPEHPTTKLKNVLGHLLTWAQNNQSWTRIYFKDLIPNPRFYRSDKYEYMRAYDKKLVTIFEEGRQKGIFRKDLKMHFFRAMVFGTRDQICLPWAMLQKQDNLIDLLDDFYEFVFNAIKA